MGASAPMMHMCRPIGDRCVRHRCRQRAAYPQGALNSPDRRQRRCGRSIATLAARARDVGDRLRSISSRRQKSVASIAQRQEIVRAGEADKAGDITTRRDPTFASHRASSDSIAAMCAPRVAHQKNPAGIAANARRCLSPNARHARRHRGSPDISLLDRRDSPAAPRHSRARASALAAYRYVPSPAAPAAAIEEYDDRRPCDLGRRLERMPRAFGTQ